LFSSAISKQEFKGYYLQFPIYKPQNRLQAINYIKGALDKLFAKVGEDEKQWQPYSFATACSTEIRKKVNDTFEPYLEKVNGLKDKLNNVNHMITQCVTAQEANHMSLKKLFSVANSSKS
jgi:hypothetical protein